MKVILTYGDLLAFEDLQIDHISTLRHRAEEFGHETSRFLEQAEATLERVREMIKVYEDEDL